MGTTDLATYMVQMMGDHKADLNGELYPTRDASREAVAAYVARLQSSAESEKEHLLECAA